MRKSTGKKGTPRRRVGATKRKATRKPSESVPQFRPAEPLSAHGMEEIIADVTRALQSRNFASIEELNGFLRTANPADLVPSGPETPLERAQRRMYEAWDASGPRRIELARQALELSPDCADAYLLLADESAATPEEVGDLLEQAVAAGERALGKEFFEESAGYFWSIVETRPYMRAREALAHYRWNIGERDLAIGHVEDLLRLNPGDNQGIRYTLARFLYATGDVERLGMLFARYDEDDSAEWLYSIALWTFRVYGDSDAASAALALALKSNPAVVPYLFGVWELPESPPLSQRPGDRSEAALYVGFNGSLWDETPGALEWFDGWIERELEGIERKRKSESRSRKPRAKRSTSAAATLYQLKVTLRDVKPPVWRRLLVHPDTPLSALHVILQAAMGWTDSHLHMFEAGNARYGVQDRDDFVEVLDERRMSIARLLPRTGSKAMYEYDFGDGWRHELLVEKLVDVELGGAYPVCTAGRRACPPEDCGGAYGYANLIAAIRDSDHPEHEEMIDWYGEDIDPELFDIDRINAELSSLFK